MSKREVKLIYGMYIYYVYVYYIYIYPSYLTGPSEIPFLGNTPLETVEQLEELRKTYGDIFT